ncbi:N,N'-diacetyllegionaminic acid synthase [Acidimicrobiaceae bacterium]|nr:N,N'-diacetyllegionaminic acid synthase [Acidimicrobiaceae bacterium]
MTNSPNTFIIAEAGVNHNGSIDLARSLIDAAVVAKADAVKFQSFVASSIVTTSARKAEYQIAQTGGQESQLEMLQRLELSHAQQRELFDYCKKSGIEFLSTPFDSESLKFLVSDLKLSTIKVGSGELTNAPFLLEVARCTDKLILSTGMSTIDEIELALGVVAFGMSANKTSEPSTDACKKALVNDAGRQALRQRVTLLHCTTDYPTSPADINLRAMLTLSEKFNCQVGLSDHSIGTHIAVGAVAMGATIIEKHLTTSRDLAGPDHKASLEPDEFKKLVANIRDIEIAFGSAEKTPTANETKNQQVARRSIVASKAIKSGEVFTTENIVVKRPGTGQSPFKYWDLLGTKSTRDIAANELI